nr:hypothetical protein [Tanacetum cinerariifolium]
MEDSEDEFIEFGDEDVLDARMTCTLTRLEHEEATASYDDLNTNVEEFCNESLEERATISSTINNTLKFIEKQQKDQHTELIEREEKIKNEMLDIYEIVKVAAKEVKEAEHVISGGKDFVKHQAKIVRIHNDKVKKNAERKMKLYDQEWDQIGPILRTKRYIVMPYMLNSLRKKYERLEEIPKSLNTDESIPLPLQDSSRLEPEFGLFFIDEFNDPAFQRVGDIYKFEINSLFGYKMMALQDKSATNPKFLKLTDAIIAERPNKHTLTSKKAKLELMGFKED